MQGETEKGEEQRAEMHKEELKIERRYKVTRAKKKKKMEGCHGWRKRVMGRDDSEEDLDWRRIREGQDDKGRKEE